jgi:hypothetical protein
MSLPALLLAISLAQTSVYDSPDAKKKAAEGEVPAYLPRAVYAGASLAGALLTPQLRLQWELNVLQARNDALVLYFEGGGGYGVSFPKNLGATRDVAMTYFYSYVLEAGLAYRAVYESGFAWGFHVGTGPVFYGARFTTAPRENTIAGMVDGGVQIGLRVGGVVYGLAFRYSNLYDPPRRQLSGPWVGGPWLGFYAEWRP